MNRKRIFITVLILCISCFSLIRMAQGQNNSDSLTLSKIISTIIQNHPSVKEGTEAINTADAAILLAKSGYYPLVNGEANYTRLGPVTSINFPGLGTFDLYPANNYSADVKVLQSIYDFGKTDKSVAYANESKNYSTMSLEQVKQKLAVLAITHYYTLLYLQDAVLINKEKQKTLQEHLDYVTKKNETGSATQYEILSTKVKISSAENEGIELETTLNNQVTDLNMLMGQTQNKSIVVKKEIEPVLPSRSSDSLVAYALSHRDEMLLAIEKTSIAQLKLNIVKAQNNPYVSFYASGGAKNGYHPEMNTLKANYTAGLGLTIPLFDATKKKSNLMTVKSLIATDNDETELARLTVTSDVLECEENMKSSEKKVEHYTLQLSQAQEAFALAQTNYEAGSITNLDLLDAATTVSESKLLLYKTKIEYVLNSYKLKAAIGERLY